LTGYKDGPCIAEGADAGTDERCKLALVQSELEPRLARVGGGAAKIVRVKTAAR
jgi:hypothetical protein